MPTDEERIRALEEFAARISTATNLGWIDQQLLELIQTAGDEAPAHPETQQLISILATGRQRIQAGQATAGAQPQPQAPQSPPAAPPAQDSAREEVARQKLIEVAVLEERTMDRAKSYEQLIVGLGYGAILALWAGVAHDIPRWDALLSAALVGASLLIYIGYHLYTLVWLTIWQRRMQDVANLQLPPTQTLALWNEKNAQRWTSSRRFLGVWMIVFPIEVILAFAGAIDLIVTAATRALTGVPH